MPRPVVDADGRDDEHDDEGHGDARFTYGLVLDVAGVLVAHGYPTPAGHDWGHLVQSLHHTLYAPAPLPSLDTDPATDATCTLTEIP